MASDSLQQLRALVQSGGSVDRPDSRGRTPLARAVRRNEPETVRVLLRELGADPDAGAHATPLAAAVYAHPECARELLEGGADVNRPSDGATPLGDAVYCAQSTALVRALLQHNADPEAVSDQTTPLMCAARAGKTHVVRALLEAQANPNASSRANPHGHTPLWLAAQADHTEAVRALLAHRADPNAQARGGCLGQTPVFALATHPSAHTDTLRLLLEAGANPDTADCRGMTPLVIAAACGHTRFVRALLAGNAAPDLRADGRTPLLAAAAGGHADAALALLEAKADPDLADTSGCTPLAAAVLSGSFDAVLVLLQAGAAVDAADNLGRSPLALAAQHSPAETVLVLLEHGASPARADNRGRTPLHDAAERGEPQMLRALCRAGADPDAPDSAEHTPLAAAARAGKHDAVAVLVRECGADPAGLSSRVRANALAFAMLAHKRLGGAALPADLVGPILRPLERLTPDGWLSPEELARGHGAASTASLLRELRGLPPDP